MRGIEGGVRLGVLLALGAVFAWGRPVGAESFAWPLPIKPGLSSTFAESRSAAFHAGIDLKTWGKTGYAVQAPAAGYIVRARTSPWGYGRALYQRLPDGRTLVYAHLESFGTEVSRRIAAAQRAKGRYSVDLWFKEGEIPVAKGAVVARSGQSGAGPPHLHLEVRDANNVPLNPLKHGFEIEDTIAPPLRRWALIPQGRGSRVDGGHAARSYGMRWNAASGYYETASVPAITGDVAVAVLAYDRADAAQNKLAPYRMELKVDGRLHLRATYGRIPYADAYQVLLDRTRLAWEGGAGAFFSLFRAEGNRLSFYEPEGADGIVQGAALGKGHHWLEVEGVEVSGNRARARLRLAVGQPPRVVSGRLARGADGLYLEAEIADADDARLWVELASSADGEVWEVLRADSMRTAAGPFSWPLPHADGIWRLRLRDSLGAQAQQWWPANPEPEPVEVEAVAYRDFVDLELRSASLQAAPPAVQVGGAAVPLMRAGPQLWRVTVPLEAGPPLAVEVQAAGAVEVLHLERQSIGPQAAAWSWGGGAAVLRFVDDAVYEPFFPQAESFVPSEVPAHLENSGFGIDLSPVSLSFKRKAEVWLRLPEEVEGAKPGPWGVYAEGGKGKWYFAGNAYDPACDCVGTKTRVLGRWAVLADRQAPKIRPLQPLAGAEVGIKPLFRLGIEDEGSGIGREEDIVLRLDGTALIAEYDPEAREVRAAPPVALKPGPHRLELELSDMSGNQARAAVEFRVRGASQD